MIIYIDRVNCIVISEMSDEWRATVNSLAKAEIYILPLHLVDVAD